MKASRVKAAVLQRSHPQGASKLIGEGALVAKAAHLGNIGYCAAGKGELPAGDLESAQHHEVPGGNSQHPEEMTPHLSGRHPGKPRQIGDSMFGRRIAADRFDHLVEACAFQQPTKAVVAGLHGSHHPDDSVAGIENRKFVCDMPANCAPAGID